jgi:hypothetical protein
MTLLRLLTACLVAIFVPAFAVASTIKAVDPGGRRITSSEQVPSSQLPGGWHFLRTRDPRGTAEAISILHTTEIVIVLIRSFPLRDRPTVIIGQPDHETQFKAIVVPPGTAILLPGDAAPLVSSSWHALNDLFIRVADGQNTIQGVVPLEGLQTAFKVLVANCPAP